MKQSILKNDDYIESRLSRACDEGRSIFSRMARDSRDWLAIVSLVQRHTDTVCDMRVTEEKWTVLHYAAWDHKAAYAEMFIANGANIHAGGLMGWTPLHIAAFSRRNFHQDQDKAAFERILNTLAGPTPIHGLFLDEASRSPLHLAASIGNYTAIEHLIKVTKFDPNAEDQYGRTPLMFVARYMPFFWYSTAVVLLENGARTHVKDVAGDDVSTIAERYDAHSLLELLDIIDEALVELRDRTL
jgi:ankyrin repeat protein